MSRTYSIACRDCKKHVWIAQASCDSHTLYTGMPEVMECLEAFLFEHMGHALVFNDNCNSEVGEWDEIEPSNGQSKLPAVGGSA